MIDFPLLILFNLLNIICVVNIFTLEPPMIK